MSERSAAGRSQYLVPLRDNAGQLEVTLPSALVDEHGYQPGDPVAFWPRVEDGNVVYDLVDGTGILRNERRLRQAGEYDQTYLRFPREIGIERGLFEAVHAAGHGPKLEIESLAPRTLRLRPRPATTPFESIDPADAIAEPYQKKLVRHYRRGNSWELRHEFPKSYLGDEGDYSVTPGDHAATRLTTVDGDLAIALDFSDDLDPDATNVRQVYVTDLQPQSGGYDLAHITFSRTFAHALKFVTLDGRAPLEFIPCDDQILVRRAGDVESEDLEWERETETKERALEGDEAPSGFSSSA
jgi:hypothetical protein